MLSKLDLELDLYKAYSGQEALLWLRRTRFDIVLSDIAMPEMDGLALMNVIRSDWPQCKMIFLTGYSHFETVYQAVQWPGIRYLLKSEGYNKLIETVGLVVSEIQEELRTAALLQNSKASQNAFDTLAAGNFVRHLLFEGGADETMSDNFNRLRIEFEPRAPVLIALGSLSAAEAHRYYADRQETALRVKILADTYLEEKSRCLGVIDRYGDLIWLVQPPDPCRPLSNSSVAEQEDNRFERLSTFLEGTFELIQEACQQSLGIQLSVTLAKEPTDWKQLPTAYDKLRERQHLRAGDGTTMVQSVLLNEEGTAAQVRLRFPKEKTETLASHLEGGRREDFLGLFNELTLTATEGGWTTAYATELYYSIALILLSYSNRWGEREKLPMSAGGLMQLDGYHSWKQRYSVLRGVAEDLFELRRDGEHNRAVTAIDKISAYIDEHIAEDLSLVRLADEIHFNPSYLSRLFKQERGIKLSEYIEDVRFARAKELLLHTEMKIAEIGASVGYEAPHSFTRVFKKWTGISPHEFREQAGKRREA
ncbi:helix-turn-helix domain-containing protein [Paenibacillus sp. PAMC21692]|uniref:response regulator transcription factor n=1 Tax=Paenibacillus sp. PAMC21692 TaxID=2762320 RepID=UPI0021C2B9A2|nr:helix-turn-helix domain-containing protein [Paenibacillus sp. PAMC21692]